MKRDAAAAHAQPSAPRGAAGDGAESPTLRLFALLEHIAAHDRLFSLQSLVEDTGWPKPSVHRMLQQLESGGLVQREGDSRHYSTGIRLRRFAERLLANGTFHGARHRVLRELVNEVGESCNITAFVGGEVVYLDRVETAAPLRFYLHPGSRVPAHASASGKIFLSQMPALQRTRLLQAAPLEKCTAATLIELPALERELAAVRSAGYGLDREEFLPGLVCVAVPVPTADPSGRSTACIALQAPAVRLPIERALQWLPALQKAAWALSRIESDATAEPEPPTTAAKVVKPAEPAERAHRKSR